MISLSPRHEVDEFRKRYKWMALFVLLTFGALFARIFSLQFIQHEMWADRARRNLTQTRVIAPTRGNLRDAQGKLVADNQPGYRRRMVPARFEMGDLDALIQILELERGAVRTLREKLDRLSPSRRVQYIDIVDLSRRQLAKLETRLSRFRGLDIATDPVRRYPFAHLASHAIGYLNEVNAEDLQTLGKAGYGPGDRIGRSGVEKHFEKELRGTPGSVRVVASIDPPSTDVAEQEELDPPIPGHDIGLTLDMRLMEYIDKAFEPHPAGAAVVVDVDSGKLRALYSKPSYDANAMTSGLSHAEYRALLDDPFRPLLDKTIYETYFPGSTFKPITAVAYLQEAEGDDHHVVSCRGRYQVGKQSFRCVARHGEVALHDALVRSCNVYFWELAQTLRLESINHAAESFGFGTESGLGINSESAGFVATRQWYVEHYGAFRPGYTMNTAIGQGNTRVTVLQLALAYAAIANRGTLYKPMLVDEIRDHRGHVVKRFSPEVRREIHVAPSDWDKIHEALRDVVATKKGTAYSARIVDGVAVSGKTGTAEVVTRSRDKIGDTNSWYFNQSHGWFAAFAPSEEPRIAIVVLVEHGRSGGRSAAPIAMKVLDAYLKESQRGSSWP